MSAHDALDREVAEYIRDVRKGEKVVGRLERLAVERHVRDLRHGPKRNLRFNLKRGRRAVWWIQNRCRFSKGRWSSEPFILSPWQKFVVYMVFGWERLSGEKWKRRFRTAYVRVARKNGKTELAAAIGLLFLLLAQESEPGAEIYSAATTKDQAALCWRAAHSMVKKSPELRRAVKQNPSRYNLVFTETESRFEALAADYDSLDGKSPLLNIIDEYHAHPNSDVRDVLDSGMGAREQPLTLIITTAGEKRSGACHEQEVDCIKALEALGEEAGAYDDVFGYIAQLDDEDDPADETKWPKANPNLGQSVTLEGLRVDARAAKRKPSSWQEFVRKKCNRWLESSNAWIALDGWDKMEEAPAADPHNRMLPPQPGPDGKKRRAVIALDLSSVRDYTYGLCMTEPDERGLYDIYCAPFIPAERLIDRMNSERAPVKNWADEGFLIATPGNVVDQDELKQWVLNCRERVEILEVAMDPHNASKLQTELKGLGFNVTSVNQNAPTLSQMIKETEKSIEKGHFRHGGHPVLRWMMANVACTKDAKENYFLNKDKSTDKIDGVVCLVMARGRWDHQKGPRQLHLGVVMAG